MPQLWIETFVSQYFWLLLILFTFYYFITTKVIPTISETIKTRQISENKELKLDTNLIIDDKATNLFNTNSKYDHNIQLITSNFDEIQEEWLSTSPEMDNTYWIDTNISEEGQEQLNIEEINELSLEDFIKSEETAK